LIAADVDNNKKVTTSDLVELRKLVLAINTKFVSNKSWRFVTKKHTFADPLNPWTAAFPETAFVAFAAAQMTNDFVGVKIGDLNGSAKTNGLKNSKGADRAANQGVMGVNVENKVFQKGDIVKIPFAFEGNIDLAACQFTMQFDTKLLDFQGFEQGNVEGVSEDIFNFNHLTDGKIAAAWINGTEQNTLSNPTICYLTFKAKQQGDLAKAIDLNDALVASEIYTFDGKASYLDLKFDHKSADAFELYQNQPNPYAQHTTISFKLAEESAVKLTIFDAAGRIIKTYNNAYNKGYQQITISKEDLNDMTGVLFYRLEAGKNSAVRKMIVLP
jgi:hypothetical protein